MRRRDIVDAGKTVCSPVTSPIPRSDSARQLVFLSGHVDSGLGGGLEIHYDANAVGTVTIERNVFLLNSGAQADVDLNASMRLVGPHVDIGAFENERIFVDGFDPSGPFGLAPDWHGGAFSSDAEASLRHGAGETTAVP